MEYGWVRVQEEDFSVEEEIKRIKGHSKRIGGIVFHLATISNLFQDKDVHRVDYEYYPGMAEKRLNEIRERALENYGVIEVSIVHRVGRIEVGENSSLVIVAAEHRKDAFTACERCADELKRIAPIWKRVETTDGEVAVLEHP